MPGKSILSKPKKTFKNTSKNPSDKTQAKSLGENVTGDSDSFKATAYVPKFWENIISIGRLSLFFVICALIFWFTIGSDMLYSFQRSTFEKNDLTGFYEVRKSEFQQLYSFMSDKNRKLTNLKFNKEDQKFEVRIEDQYMSKNPRPLMVMQVSHQYWRRKDYEKVINGHLFLYRNGREKTIEKNWMYDFKLDQNQQVQSDILAYLNTTQNDFSSILSTLKEVGQDFEIFPDSIVTTLNHHEFGSYHLLYHDKDATNNDWNKIDEHIYFKKAPKISTD